LNFHPASVFQPLRQVIRHDDLRHIEKCMGTYVSAAPVWHLLAGLGFGIGIAAGAQGGHENLRLTYFPRFRIGDRNGIPGIIHEQLSTRLVVLPHGWIKLPDIAPE